MESKRKSRKVPKVRKAQTPPLTTQELSGEQLIRRNGEMVEELLASEVWREIVSPLFHEAIAGVSGRYTNGRFHHGDLTRRSTNLDFLSGYQKGLMDLHNYIRDFVDAKDKLVKDKKAEAKAAAQPMINPFLEDAE